MKTRSNILRGFCLYGVAVMVALAFAAPGCNRRAAFAPGDARRDSLTITDAFNTKVVVPQPVVRAVSLAPNLTEMLFAIGAQDKLVGVTRYCTYPDAAQSIAKVGDLQTPDYELLVALRPDVVFMSVSGNMPQAYAKLRDLGMRPLLTSSKTIDDVEMSIRTVAHVMGRDSAGNALADGICSAVDSIRAGAARHPPVDAAILLSIDPPVAVGSGFLDEALAVAGGRNVMHDDMVVYPQISREAFVRRAPRVVFIPADVPESIDEIWRTFPEWRVLRAGGTRIVRVDADPLMRPGPRIVQAIREMARALTP